MTSITVNLQEAKVRLSELTELAAAGATVIITKRGEPMAQLSRLEQPRKAVDLDQLKHLTDATPPQRDEAGELMRRLRDQARY